MSAVVISTGSIVFNLIGVIILFLFGMPFQVRAGGGDIITTNPTDNGKQRETIYSMLSWIGLVLIAVAAIGQVIALWLPVD